MENATEQESLLRVLFILFKVLFKTKILSFEFLTRSKSYFQNLRIHTLHVPAASSFIENRMSSRCHHEDRQNSLYVHRGDAQVSPVREIYPGSKISSGRRRR